VNYWPLVVTLLTFNGIAGDVLAKKNHILLPMLLWTLGNVVWIYLFRSGVSLGRSVSLNCVLSYVLTLVLAYATLGETLTALQVVGALLGLIAIVLLA
jgi:uncharacterized membrane protein